MTQNIADRLRSMDIELPEAPAAAANYAPWVMSGNQLFVSGQLPMKAGALTFTGLLGRDLDVAAGRNAAELCAINILAQARSALSGELERVARLIKISGFVASTHDFVEQHLVVNGASDLLAEILAERGRHARIAVGTASLPLNAAVEIDAIFQIA